MEIVVSISNHSMLMNSEQSVSMIDGSEVQQTTPDSRGAVVCWKWWRDEKWAMKQKISCHSSQIQQTSGTQGNDRLASQNEYYLNLSIALKTVIIMGSANMFFFSSWSHHSKVGKLFHTPTWLPWVPLHSILKTKNMEWVCLMTLCHWSVFKRPKKKPTCLASSMINLMPIFLSM